MSTQSLTTIAHEEGKVILPFKEDQFHSFLKSLLGQEQTIEKTFYKTFGLNRDDVKHLHALITQRVAQQNPSHFLGLKASLYFSDNSLVTFSTIELLCAYNEIKPVKSTRLLLCWTFLVTFADRQAPEKQEVEIIFGGTEMPSDEPIVIMHRRGRRVLVGGNIGVSIRHSARSWGIDIENIITSYIENIARPENTLLRLLKNREEALGSCVGGLFFCGTLYTVFWTCSRSANLTRQHLDQALQKVSEGNEIAWLKAHVQTLVEIQMQAQFMSKDIQMLMFIALSLLAAVFLGLWVPSLLPFPVGGHVLFSRKSEEAYARTLIQEEKSLKHLILAFLGSMTTGLACNYFYAWITSPSR